MADGEGLEFVAGGDLGVALSAIGANTVLMPCKTDLDFRTRANQAELQYLRRGRLVETPPLWGHMSGAGQHEPDTLFIDAHLRAPLAASTAPVARVTVNDAGRKSWREVPLPFKSRFWRRPIPGREEAHSLN